jgi:phospholipase C
MRNRKLKSALLSTVATLAVAAAVASFSPVIANDHDNDRDDRGVNPNHLKTKTPIKHLVIVFNENRSFDHYFGFYPNAANVKGEPRFEPSENTPTDIDNLLTTALLDNNPNLNPANGVGASNPFRLDRSQANTRSQNHAYTPEQLAADNGKMDLFPAWVGRGTSGGAGGFGTTAQTMGIFDGNTITALWNYAQNYAMSDNMWGDTYGPSTPGLLNMFAGQTNGIVVGAGTSSNNLPDGQGGITLIGDVDPTFDVCSSTTSNVSSTAKNIGDLLNAANIPWGSFYGGFDLTRTNPGTNTTGCARSTVSPIEGTAIVDYIPHHIWNQYFKSTANPTHARPTSIKAIGHTNVPGTNQVDPANHNYDTEDFFAAVGSGNFPAVSFIKMPAYQDSHPGNSDPLDEQTGFVNLVNFLQEQPDWESTVVILTYDDSDGWYDHAFAKPHHGSFSTDLTQTVTNNGTTPPTTTKVAADQLNGNGVCGVPGTAPLGVNGLPVNGRCGVGPRLPFLVISPWAKQNHVDHVFITQASIPQFIEDNWLNGERLGGGSFDAETGSIMGMFDFKQKKSVKLILDPELGTVISEKKFKN